MGAIERTKFFLQGGRLEGWWDSENPNPEAYLRAASDAVVGAIAQSYADFYGIDAALVADRIRVAHTKGEFITTFTDAHADLPLIDPSVMASDAEDAYARVWGVTIHQSGDNNELRNAIAANVASEEMRNNVILNSDYGLVSTGFDLTFANYNYEAVENRRVNAFRGLEEAMRAASQTAFERHVLGITTPNAIDSGDQYNGGRLIEILNARLGISDQEFLLESHRLRTLSTNHGNVFTMMQFYVNRAQGAGGSLTLEDVANIFLTTEAAVNDMQGVVYDVGHASEVACDIARVYEPARQKIENVVMANAPLPTVGPPPTPPVISTATP